LNAYAAAHPGETIGKVQWGNAVPLFGAAAGYQRNDNRLAAVLGQHPGCARPQAQSATRDDKRVVTDLHADCLLMPICVQPREPRRMGATTIVAILDRCALDCAALCRLLQRVEHALADLFDGAEPGDFPVPGSLQPILVTALRPLHVVVD
jgi:hypothetical protein